MKTALVIRRVALSLFLLLLPIASSHVSAALIFEFSFSDDPADDNLGNTKVPGTVTGRILGLVDNTAGQAASSVFIDSFPILNAGFGPLDVSGIDLVAGSIFANSFDVSGGVVTDAYFISNFAPNNGGTAQLRLNSQDGQEDGANVLRHQNVTGPDQLAVGNRDGLQGVSFNVPSPGIPVPVPATLALTGLGLLSLRLLRRRT